MLEERINEDLKEALRSKDQLRASCLRMLKTQIKNRSVEKMRPLTDEEIIQVIQSLVKKGREAIDEFRKGNREDLASKEEQEVKVYMEYLPQMANEEEVERVVKEVLAELGAKGPKDMGRVMKEAMARLRGRAEGKLVSEVAKRLLS
jgi:uncharacterized protein YqeY